MQVRKFIATVRFVYTTFHRHSLQTTSVEYMHKYTSMDPETNVYHWLHTRKDGYQEHLQKSEKIRIKTGNIITGTIQNFQVATIMSL